MIRSAYVNQWVIRGGNSSVQELDKAVNETLHVSARSQFDLYHNIRNPAMISQMVNYSPATEEILERIREAKQGILVVGLHVSNLDIGFIALSQANIRLLALSVPQPGGGYQWQNDLREELGFEFIPVSKKALRSAHKRLEEGGAVVTGIDRPILGNNLKHRPMFFQRLSALPVFHILIALKSKVPIHVSANIIEEDGKYHLDVSEPIKMHTFQDRNKEIIFNAEAVLEVAEDFISRVPSQWAMYYPVWPELINEVPR